MKENTWTYLTALGSVTLGWFLNALSQWFSTRKGDKRVKKQVLYNLLEVHHTFNRFDISDEINYLTDKIVEKLPNELQSDETKEHLNKLYSQMMHPILEKDMTSRLQDLEERYYNSIDELAKTDPLQAYSLRGKTQIMSTFNLLKDYFEEAKKKFPGEETIIEQASSMVVDIVKPDIIQASLREIKKEIKSVAFSIDAFTWFKVKKHLKKKSEGLTVEEQKRAEKLLTILWQQNALQID